MDLFSKWILSLFQHAVFIVACVTILDTVLQSKTGERIFRHMFYPIDILINRKYVDNIYLLFSCALVLMAILIAKTSLLDDGINEKNFLNFKSLLPFILYLFSPFVSYVCLLKIKELKEDTNLLLMTIAISCIYYFIIYSLKVIKRYFINKIKDPKDQWQMLISFLLFLITLLAFFK